MLTSTLTWIDHDAAARERSLRILALFRERDTRDELGLGAIRDSFSDQLFPGTSTIQTRLRYMLFVPWVYQSLEAARVPTSHFAARARRLELDLIGPLLESDDRAGVFGSGAGRALKRLPSEVYWAGLGAWRIRRFDGSNDEYHRRVDRVYALRGRRREHDDDDETAHPGAITWHPRLPATPEGFPESLDFALTREEAEFLRDAIVTSCPGTLIAWLAREERAGRGARRPWEHPDYARFPERIRRLLHHARLFSAAMQGAAILYNLALAELDGRAKLGDEHRERFRGWSEALPEVEISNWDLDEFWQIVINPRHAVTPGARRFVEDWVWRMRGGTTKLTDDQSARQLVERRERSLKKARSRFANTGARLQWGGRSGLDPMTFRWETARIFLDDLHRGLHRR